MFAATARRCLRRGLALNGRSDVRDPDFARRHMLRAHQQHRDVAELIAGTKETLAASGALLEEADRLLELR
jgi:hypothetical protein